jgi:hypothetical protein
MKAKRNRWPANCDKARNELQKSVLLGELAKELSLRSDQLFTKSLRLLAESDALVARSKAKRRRRPSC